MRKLFAILTMLAALMLASVTAFAAPSLVDNAKLLTPQQRHAIDFRPLSAAVEFQFRHIVKAYLVILAQHPVTIHKGDSGSMTGREQLLNESLSSDRVLLQS